MDMRLVQLDGTWTVLADGEPVFATPDRTLALDLARSFGEQFSAEQSLAVALYAEGAGPGEQLIARYGEAERRRSIG